MNSTPEPKPSRFPATRWSLLQAAKSGSEERRLQALEAFLRAYYDPLLAYIVRQFRMDPDAARDCLHEFVLNRLVRRNLLAQADRSRGKFRNLLLCTLNRFVLDQQRKAQSARRSPGRPVESLDALGDEAVDHLTEAAQPVFDLEFARGAVHLALRRMRERCEQTQRKDLWKVFHERVLGATLDGAKPVPYDQLTALLGVSTHAHAANLLTSAKRMFVRVFKSVVRDYAADDEAVESEIQALRRILSHR